jgi:hypothetical protein
VSAVMPTQVWIVFLINEEPFSNLVLGSASPQKGTPSNQPLPASEPLPSFTDGAVSLSSSHRATPPSGPTSPVPTGPESDAGASTDLPSSKPALSIPESPALLTSAAAQSSLAPAAPTSQSSDGLASSPYATKLGALTVNDMPPWLHAILDYLRQVSAEDTWQELVFRLVTFESRHPPVGVSVFFKRFYVMVTF